MPAHPDPLAVDLQAGVLPISKTSAALAALLTRSREQHKPFVVTQKGYPTAVLLGIELYTTLRERAMRAVAAGKAQAAPAVEPASAAEPAELVEAPAEPARKPRGGRRAKTEGQDTR